MLPPTAIPRMLHLVDDGAHPSDPVCTLLGQGRWDVRRYTEAQATAFVHREFPEHDALYRSLASWPMQRQAVFRLLVLLRLGGVVLGQDVDCRSDLGGLLLQDSMVVGWQPGAGGVAGGVVGMEMMAAAPGHPVLRATLQRLEGLSGVGYSNDGGQGVGIVQAQWTMAVLAYASNATDLKVC